MLLFLPLTGNGQKSAYESELLNMFDLESIDNLNIYEGTLANIHHIRMVLANMDSTIIGYYEYVESRSKFELEGSLVNGQYEVLETDDNDNISAHLIFKIDNGIILGDWKHIDHNMSHPINLKRVNNFKNKSICSKNNWTKVYRGEIDQVPIKLQLEKKLGKIDKANIILDGAEFDYSLDPIEKNIFLVDLSEMTSVYDKLFLEYRSDHICKLKLVKSNHEEILAKIPLVDELAFDCQEKADYNTRLELVYPVAKDPKFNEWFDKEIEAWSKKYRLEMKNLLTLELLDHPESRFKFVANGWVDIHHFSEQFISGLLSFQNNWKDTNIRKAFIFDRTNGEFLDSEDLFASNNIHEIIESFVERHKTEYPPFKEKMIRVWLQNQEFEYLSLSNNGLNLSTEFSTIFGSKTIFLPYSEVKDELSNKYQKILLEN